MRRVTYTLAGMALALPIPIGIAWIADRVDRDRASDIAMRIEHDVPGIRTRVTKKPNEYPIIAMTDRRMGTARRLEASLDQDGLLVLSYLDAGGCLVQLDGSVSVMALIGALRANPVANGTRYPSTRTCAPASDR